MARKNTAVETARSDLVFSALDEAVRDLPPQRRLELLELVQSHVGGRIDGLNEEMES